MLLAHRLFFIKMADSSDEDMVAAAAALIVAASAKKKRRRTHRRCWVSKMNESRPIMGAFHTTIAMMEVADCQTTFKSIGNIYVLLSQCLHIYCKKSKLSFVSGKHFSGS